MLLTLVAKSKTRYYLVGVVVSFLLFGTLSGIDSGVLFKASTLNSVTHDPFDGTSYPYLHAVDWVNLRGDQRDANYGDIPSSKKLQPLSYNARNLRTEFASLDFGDEGDNSIRNQKVTYSVPYMGNYKLDGKEFGGSHPAVDIKMPTGTPILSVANGIVTKVSNQDWGFGKSIVVMHRGVPDPKNPGRKTTLYSSYSHLGSFAVSEFDVVSKGEVIGYSGSTGTSTTPHLHFQIDTDDAPYHPYWPFTGAEARAAGLDFTSAVNQGLGSANGVKYTVHPLEFVQKHLGTASYEEEAEEKVEEDTKEDPKEEEKTEEKEDSKEDEPEEQEEPEVEKKVVEKKKTKKLPEVTVKAPREMVVGQEYDIVMKFDTSNSVMASLDAGSYKFKPSLLSTFTVPGQLDFSKDVVIPFRPNEVGDLDIVIRVGGIQADVRNIDVKLFKDVTNNDSSLKAMSFLKNRGIITGYSDFTFNPDGKVTRAEAAKLLASALPSDIIDRGEISCNDFERDAWYKQYFDKAYDAGSITPGSDGNCRPDDQITGYEYLKMLMTNVDLDPKVDDTYSRYFELDAWFAPYLQEAIERNLITATQSAKMNKPLSRRDIAELTYRFIRIVEGRSEVYSN